MPQHWSSLGTQRPNWRSGPKKMGSGFIGSRASKWHGAWTDPKFAKATTNKESSSQTKCYTITQMNLTNSIWQSPKRHLDFFGLSPIFSPFPWHLISFTWNGGRLHRSKVTTIYTCHISDKCWMMLCTVIVYYGNYLAPFQEKSIVPATTLSMIVIVMISASNHSHHTEECSALFHLCDFVWGSPSKDFWHKSVTVEKWKDFHVLWQFL